VSAHQRPHSKHGSSKSPSRPGSRPMTGQKNLAVRAFAVMMSIFSVFNEDVMFGFYRRSSKFCSDWRKRGSTTTCWRPLRTFRRSSWRP
jgi:hypothetical protein